ncbi:MAG TPA: DinB family protein [Nitrolancea sp.]
MNREQLLNRIDKTWTAFTESFAGLTDEEMQEPGVEGDWSVRDLMTHVSIWEDETLKYLPLIAEGGRPPRYAAQGGIDAFNARAVGARRGLTSTEVRQQLDETHRRLIAYVQSVPEEQFATETRFRHRLRVDTYSHYPEHTAAIRHWRERATGD